MLIEFKREIGLFLTRERLVLWCLLSFFAALTGPFGSYRMAGFGTALAYWACVISSAMVLSTVFLRLVQRFGAHWRPVMVDLVIVLLVTAFISPLVFGWTLLFYGPSLEGRPGLAGFMLIVAGVSATIRVLRHLSAGFDSATYVMPRALRPPRLTRRLDDGFTGPILRLSARDHSVDVVSASDSASLRMRLSDAIDEMDTVKGVLTHRSHWVARDAIAGTMRENGRINLRLTNGDVVPVSRGYKDGLEKQGLI